MFVCSVTDCVDLEWFSKVFLNPLQNDASLNAVLPEGGQRSVLVFSFVPYVGKILWIF